ncbi:Nipped-B-like protein B [Durusdinium trenchii]|uniref:Nipped-B-like protein B n=1 Tax=Durusdinium trenchii TaxID=1381693 RepID=A0ABP0HT49_9DINO
MAARRLLEQALPGALGGEERSVPSSGQEVEVKLLPRKTPGESLENKVLLAPRSAPLERRKVEPPVSLLQRGLRDLVAQPPVPPTVRLKERRVPSETSSPVGVRLQARRDAPTLHARRVIEEPSASDEVEEEQDLEESEERDADPVDFDDEEERKRAKNHAFATAEYDRSQAGGEIWHMALPALPSHVLRAVDRLYQAQLQKAQGERERLERGKGAKNFTRWNKQELYLNEDSRERAKDASHRHLQRHPELWTLRSTELFEVVALQHLLEIDLEDLSLPPEERRSEDTFTGKDLAVCEQLLLDAPRELFVIDGVEFDFARECAGAHRRVGGDGLEVLKRDFGDRLVAQLRITLGGSTVKLMRAVTCALSQSGLAHLEQACAPTLQVAVSGGEQEVRFELSSHEVGGPWDLRLFLRKASFKQCIVYSPPQDEESSPKACSPSSFFLKSCRVRYSVVGEEVQVDVLSINQEHQLLNLDGSPLLKHTSTCTDCLPFERLSGLLNTTRRCCACCAASVRRLFRRPRAVAAD